MKKYYLIICLIIISIFIFSCSGNVKLDGTWIPNEKLYWYELDGKIFEPSIEFNGNKFKVIQFPIMYKTIRNTIWGNEINKEWEGIIRLFKEEEYDNFILIEEEKKGNMEILYYRDERKGTFSIKENKIEFIFNDNSIDVLNFSRTDNTIVLGDLVFTKKNN